MRLLPVCQDAVGDVSDGQTNRPGALPSVLHDVKRSVRQKNLSVLDPSEGNKHLVILTATVVGYLSNKGFVTLDPAASSV